MRETWGSNTLDFFYDSTGKPYAVKYNGTLYYYITNLQGDVLHITNSSGTTVVSYTYDPYGKPLSVTGSRASTLGAANPLRYRGYVYDEDTGLYYLQSRYYDPTTCRFINADSYASTGQGILGCNMFAYCLNSPVRYKDLTGDCPYDGTIEDFNRLNQGLPPRNCTCKLAEVFYSTKITVTATDENNKISAWKIEVSVVDADSISVMTDSELSEYVRLLERRLGYLSSSKSPLKEGQRRQLLGEFKMHIMGWETRHIHPFDKNCEIIDIDIIGGIVKDPRPWVNIVSSFMGKVYYAK